MIYYPKKHPVQSAINLSVTNLSSFYGSAVKYLINQSAFIHKIKKETWSWKMQQNYEISGSIICLRTRVKLLICDFHAKSTQMNINSRAIVMFSYGFSLCIAEKLLLEFMDLVQAIFPSPSAVLFFSPTTTCVFVHIPLCYFFCGYFFLCYHFKSVMDILLV